MTAPGSDPISQGDVWWASLGPTRGREQQGFRPVVVVSSNAYLAVIDILAIVVPVTTVERGWSNHVRVTGPTGLPSASWAMTEQPTAIARVRLARSAGRVDAACLQGIRLYLGDFLGL